MTGKSSGEISSPVRSYFYRALCAEPLCNCIQIGLGFFERRVVSRANRITQNEEVRSLASDMLCSNIQMRNMYFISTMGLCGFYGSCFSGSLNCSPFAVIRNCTIKLWETSNDFFVYTLWRRWRILGDSVDVLPLLRNGFIALGMQVCRSDQFMGH